MTSHVIPGGPGRPSGSHYGEPAIDGRHGRNEREAKARVSPVYRNGSGDRTRRIVERRRASARVLFANGTRSHAARADGFAACRLAVRIYVLTEASSGAPLPRVLA